MRPPKFHVASRAGATTLSLALLAGCQSFAPGQAPVSLFDAPPQTAAQRAAVPPNAGPAPAAPRPATTHNPAVLSADPTPKPSAAPSARPSVAPSAVPSVLPPVVVAPPRRSGGGSSTPFVTDHGAALTGMIVAPSAALIAALAADVEAGRLEGLSAGSPFVTDHGGGFVTDHGAGYRLLHHDAPLAGARVQAVDAEGHALTDAVTTDADGRYRLPINDPPGGIIFVKATIAGDHPLSLMTAIEAEEGDALTANVDAATTMVGKKLATMAAMGAVPLEDVEPEAADRVGEAVGEALTARGMAVATLLDGYDTAVAFDHMLADDDDLKAEVAAIVAEVGGADFTGPTPPLDPDEEPPAPPGITATRVGAEIRLAWENLDVTTPVGGQPPDKLKIYIKAGWSPWFTLRDVDDATGTGAFTLPPGDYTFAVRAMAGDVEGPDQAESRVTD